VISAPRSDAMKISHNRGGKAPSLMAGSGFRWKRLMKNGRECWKGTRRIKLLDQHHRRKSRAQFPSLVKGGWPRSGGVVRSRNNFLDQHHPGASRHPSSAEEGIFCSPHNAFRRQAFRDAKIKVRTRS
jgi:hypothetical protein